MALNLYNNQILSEELEHTNSDIFDGNKGGINIGSFEEVLLNLLTKKGVEHEKFNINEKVVFLKNNGQLELLEKYRESFDFLDYINSRSGFQLKKTVEKSNSFTSKTIKNFINIGNGIVNNIFSLKKINTTDLSAFSLDERYIKNPNLLYEQILSEETLENKGIELNNNTDFGEELMGIINSGRISKGVSNDSVNKWIPLVKETFQDNKSEMIDLFVDELGFIPEELYTKLLFNNNTFDNISDFHYLLRKKENEANKNKDIEKIQKIKYARSIFLRYIFFDKSGKKGKINKSICDSQKSEDNNQVSLDTNGVWIRIYKGKKSISSHLPYSLCTDDLINTWFENGWINSEEFLEINKQKAKDNQNNLRYNNLELSQIDNCISNFGINIEKKSSILEKLNHISNEIINNPKNLSFLLVQKDIFIPNIIFDYILNSEELKLSKNDRYHKLFIFAEAITTQISKEVLFDDNKMFSSYDLAYRSRNAYQIRMKYLHDNPKHYNVFKVLETIFSNKLPANSIGYDFIIFRGNYKSQRGNQSFIEIIHDNVPSRILFSDEKHLPSNLMEKVNKIPTFEKQMYENIELLMRTFSLGKRNLKILKEELQEVREEIEIPDIIKLVYEYGMDIILFVLNYIPDSYQEINKKFINILTHNTADRDLFFSKIGEFIDIIDENFSDADNNIGGYLNNKNNVDIVSNITSRTVEFDNDYLEKIKKQGLKDYAYYEDFFDGKTSIDVVTVKGKNESSSISYMDESIAINKLNLSDKKPLIIVSGGCKNVSVDGVSLLDILSEKVVEIGAKKGANISIPCTQSGIGNSLGLAYKKYQDLTVGIQDSKKLRMFAVAPGKIMFDPDNNLLGTDDSFYAPSPVDQVYFDYRSDWDISGKGIVESEYFQFIESAESIYNRIDKDKSRVHIIMNGGLFSIAESMAAMKNGAKTSFIKGTGRFADAMASILENIGEFSILSLGEDNLKTFGDYIKYFGEFDSIVKKNMLDDDYSEWKRKDWGADIELNDEIMNKNIDSFEDFYDVYSDNSVDTSITPKHILYRVKMREFLILSLTLGKKSEIIEVDKLEKTLDTMI